MLISVDSDKGSSFPENCFADRANSLNQPVNGFLDRRTIQQFSYLHPDES